jgi:hypothetical protein
LGQLHYLSSFAELGVADLDASVRWYEDVLGFQRIANYGDAVHMRRGEGQDLLLRPGAGITWNLATDAAEGPESLELRDPDGHVLRVYARERPGPPRRR